MKFQKNHSIVIFAVAFVLLIPLIAMQFTHEVNWTIIDFIIAAILLLSTGFLLNYIRRNVKDKVGRIIFIIFVLFIFLFIWLELAVGIFGTSLSGS